jgi:hypothetical protein
MGIAWVPLFFVGVVIALVLAASIPPSEPQEYHNKAEDKFPPTQRPEVIGVSAFFWILVIILIVAIISGLVF